VGPRADAQARRAPTPAPTPGAGAAAPAQTASLPGGGEAGLPMLTDPNYRSRTPPVYPRRAVELGHQGEVIVEAMLDEAGVPRSAHVHRSSGYPLLDAAALEAVRGWRFVPAQHGGRSIAARVRLPVRFRLN
jgi:protein TonB